MATCHLGRYNRICHSNLVKHNCMVSAIHVTSVDHNRNCRTKPSTAPECSVRNTQRVKAVVNGEVRYIRVTANALKKGLVVKAPKRIWKKEAAAAWTEMPVSLPVITGVTGSVAVID